MKELARRGKESHVYRKYQLVGLLIAEILKDETHRSLYIKLAKEGNARALLKTAKEIAENNNVRNKGAYFMWMVHNKGELITKKQMNKLTPKTEKKRRKAISG